MKKNIGSLDKAIRIIAAVIIVALFFTNVITGIFAIVLMVFAVMLIVTSLFNVCPMYPVLGMNTRKKE